MSKWTVYAEGADYPGVLAWSAKDAMDSVWRMTCGRCGALLCARRES